MSYIKKQTGLVRVPVALSSTHEEPFDIERAIKAHGAALKRLNEIAERDLFFRKITTAAAVAGALFAAVRLTDIWLAVKARKRPQ